MAGRTAPNLLDSCWQSPRAASIEASSLAFDGKRRMNTARDHGVNCVTSCRSVEFPASRARRARRARCRDAITKLAGGWGVGPLVVQSDGRTIGRVAIPQAMPLAGLDRYAASGSGALSTVSHGASASISLAAVANCLAKRSFRQAANIALYVR